MEIPVASPPPIVKSDAEPTLVRGLSLLDSVLLLASGIIGSSIFLTAKDIAGPLPQPILFLGVWVLGGVISLFGCVAFAELGSMFPDSGGQYIYLREAYGDLPAFLYGWMLFSVANGGSIAALYEPDADGAALRLTANAGGRLPDTRLLFVGQQADFAHSLAGARDGSLPCVVRIQHRFEIGDNLLWLRLFEFHALEVRRRELERVEQKTGGFTFESLLQNHLHDLVDDGLNGVRIFESGQVDFAGCVPSVVITLDGHGTILLMIKTKCFIAKGGRTTLDSADLDVLATSCCE